MMTCARSSVRLLLSLACCLTLFVASAKSQDAATRPDVAPQSDAAKRSDAAQFAHLQEGELPIILSAPHGGQLAVPDVDVRRGEGIPKGPKGFVSGRDGGTEELGLQVAAEIERRYGKKPYVVFARAHRKYLDPNRPAHIAYEDPDAKPVYDLYHGKLDEYCRAVQQKFGRGLLLDIHGQASRKDTVFRGTQDGKTVTLLRTRFGEGAHAGDESFFGKLKSRGWTVHPDPLDGKEQDGFRGGYIVQTYGSHQGYGIDAIQLEFGQDYRDPQRRRATAKVLVDAIADYGASYLDLPQPPVPTTDEPTIVVAVYVGAGASKSRGSVVAALADRPNIELRDITAKEIQDGQLAGCDVLIQPGGSGSGQGKALGEIGRQKVRDFVAAGGGYVGVCAGAYLATCDYDWSLNILDAKVIDREHWARGYGQVELKLFEPAKEILSTDRPGLTIYYHQGPLLAPADNPQIEDYRELAKFETEIAKNGAPKGVMPGTTAIAAGQCQKGRVLCFSPHPELTKGEEQLLVEGVEWVAGVRQATR